MKGSSLLALVLTAALTATLVAQQRPGLSPAQIAEAMPLFAQVLDRAYG